MIMIMTEDAGHDQELEKKLLFKDSQCYGSERKVYQWRERENVSSRETEKRD